MAKTTASKKAKGSRLENKVAGLYRHYGLFPNAKRQLLSGGGYLKGDIYKGVDDWACDECKCHENIAIPEWWGQTKVQCGINQEPVLHISSNRRPIVTVWLAKTAKLYINNSGLNFEVFTRDKKTISLWSEFEKLRQYQYAVLFWNDKAIMSCENYMILRTYENSD